jgi:ornithine cyclodeaminase/alanine dehydrogenase-like protein (mu-crystallin family)
VRPIRHIKVFSPNEERRKAFAAAMSRECGVDVVPVATPEDAVRGLDIVITATTAREPVLKGDWVAAGAHLNIIGSNFLGKAEIDVATVKRAHRIVIDSKDQGRIEAGDFHLPIEEGVLHWSNVQELGHIIAGRVPGRGRAEEITLFKSLGLAIEDVATAAKVYAAAKERGVGRMLDVL